jgi:type III pantothenate kinase
MKSGVINGIKGEMESFIEGYRKLYPDLKVIICGGQAKFFESRLKASIFAVPELVLTGLNRILEYNE